MLLLFLQLKGKVEMRYIPIAEFKQQYHIKCKHSIWYLVHVFIDLFMWIVFVCKM